MAKLFINRDIVAEKDKNMNWWLTGDSGMSFSDIQSFMDWMDPNDNNIDVELHSCGGDCVEGYAIYDALRASGKQISCKVVGECASMASVILLAAPLERRTMYQHARILIHSPYYPSGIGGELTAEKLQSYANDLLKERQKMVDLYVERTGKDAAVIEAQMATNNWFEADRAIELGFVSSVAPAMSASIRKNVEPYQGKVMKKDKKTVAAAFRMLGEALGITKAVSMVLTTSTGDELTVEREEGEIEVGDAASPDGTFVLEDGRTVVVEDGVITEIRETESETEVEELEARIAELEQQVSDLTASAKTEEENQILAYVAKAGGLEKLKKTSSSYVPAGRTSTTGKKSGGKQESMIAKKLEEIRKKRKGGNV